MQHSVVSSVCHADRRPGAATERPVRDPSPATLDANSSPLGAAGFKMIVSFSLLSTGENSLNDLPGDFCFPAADTRLCFRPQFLQAGAGARHVSLNGVEIGKSQPPPPGPTESESLGSTVAEVNVVLK